MIGSAAFWRLAGTWAAALLLLATGTAAALEAAEPVRIENCRVKFGDTLALASERPGVLASVLKPGDVASAGAVVAQLRDDALRVGRAIAAKQAADDIEIRFARKSADLAVLKHSRALAANQSQPGAVSGLELSEMKLDAERAQLQRERAEHERAIAQLRLQEIDADLESLRVRAPLPVFVRAVHKRPGEFVQQGEVIADVVNPHRVRIEGFATPRQAVGLPVGAEVRIHAPAAGSAPLTGEIVFVDVMIEPVSGRVRIAAEASNERGRLRDGMHATLFAPAGAATDRTPQRVAAAAK